MPNPYDACNAAGGMTAYNWSEDPKRLAFQFARYKLVAKLLEGKSRVLEVGCSDGQGARIVRQFVHQVVAVDVDPEAIKIAKGLASPRWPVDFRVADILRESFSGFEAVYCLDVFEHLPDEAGLLAKLRVCAPVCIVGAPSLESQQYASAISNAGHVNCVTKQGLRERMQRHFRHVFMLGMNDETIHTGHDAMTHYLFGIGVA